MSAITLDQAAIPSEKVGELYRYWQGLRGERTFPRKADLDPSHMKRLLPFLILSDITAEPLSVRFRLMGTRAVESWGADWTGRLLHEGPWSEQSIAEDLDRYRYMLEVRRPIFGLETWTWPWRDPYQLRSPYAWSYLPLSDDGETITHCLGIDDIDSLDMAAIAREARADRDLSNLQDE
jgi:hypothetical protein